MLSLFNNRHYYTYWQIGCQYKVLILNDLYNDNHSQNNFFNTVKRLFESNKSHISKGLARSVVVVEEGNENHSHYLAHKKIMKNSKKGPCWR